MSHFGFVDLYWKCRNVMEMVAVQIAYMYQLCCGIQWTLREAGHDVNIFEQFQFAQFLSVLDGELKRLNDTANYIEKRRQMLLIVRLWE